MRHVHHFFAAVSSFQVSHQACLINSNDATRQNLVVALRRLVNPANWPPSSRGPIADFERASDPFHLHHKQPDEDKGIELFYELNYDFFSQESQVRNDVISQKQKGMWTRQLQMEYIVDFSAVSCS